MKQYHRLYVFCVSEQHMFLIVYNTDRTVAQTADTQTTALGWIKEASVTLVDTSFDGLPL